MRRSEHQDILSSEPGNTIRHRLLIRRRKAPIFTCHRYSQRQHLPPLPRLRLHRPTHPLNLEQTYTLEQLSAAAAPLMDAGKISEALCDLKRSSACRLYSCCLPINTAILQRKIKALGGADMNTETRPHALLSASAAHRCSSQWSALGKAS